MKNSHCISKHHENLMVYLKYLFNSWEMTLYWWRSLQRKTRWYHRDTTAHLIITHYVFTFTSIPSSSFCAQYNNNTKIRLSFVVPSSSFDSNWHCTKEEKTVVVFVVLIVVERSLQKRNSTRETHQNLIRNTIQRPIFQRSHSTHVINFLLTYGVQQPDVWYRYFWLNWYQNISDIIFKKFEFDLENKV